MWRLFLLFLATEAMGNGGGNGDFCDGGTLIHALVCLPANYTKTDLPQAKNEVEVGFEVNDFPAIDDRRLTVSVNFYLCLEWVEPRLVMGETFADGTDVTVNLEAIQRHLWKPDLFIMNLVAFEEMRVLDSLSGLTIHSDKTVEYFTTVTVTVSCHMNFEWYPMDQQECALYIQSSNYVSDEIVLTSYNMYDEAGSNRLQDFHISIGDIGEDERTMTEYNNDTFSQVGIKIYMRRFPNVFIITYYVPCGAMVVVSFISFSVPHDAIPGRVALLVTVFLVLSTFFGDIQATTPISQGLTALSTYALVCLLFVFAAMIEFAVILFAMRKAGRDRQVARLVKIKPVYTMGSKNFSPKKSYSSFVSEANLDDFCYRTDKRAFVGFSAVFLVFNAVYVVVHMH